MDQSRGSEDQTAAEATSDVDVQSAFVASVPGERTIDYRWYDMFNVPFGEWWSKRWQVTRIEQPLTDSYPYIFAFHGIPPGNVKYYTNMRLNITGSDIPQINMNERPEFLPFLGTERGGNVGIDWHMQYLTSAEVQARLPMAVSWNDGWFVNLKGTIILDEQAAKAVLGVTDAGFDSFAQWWATNNMSVSVAYQDWIIAQSISPFDIHPMYDYDLNWIDWEFWCEKWGNYVVVHMDTVSWGMEVMMARWMHDSFMPTEWYYEDMRFDMWIGPTSAGMMIDTAVVYAAQALETAATGEPCWVWQAMLGDYAPSEPPVHPHSDYDKYMPFTYMNLGPGSLWYGQETTYDYTPGAWNLSAGETLRFEWPSGEQLFIKNVMLGHTQNFTEAMTVDYTEPSETDFPSQINLDLDQNAITFTGPIDMWNWSKNQNTHARLSSEWDRIGLLPYGIPYIEFSIAGSGPPAPGNPEISYKIYDLFEEPFGQWWWGNSATYKGRIVKYQTDSILWNETHKHAYLYDNYGMGLSNEHAIIMAPYHWSMDARNITWVTTSNPYFMPDRYVDFYGNPAPSGSGTEVTIDLRFQYIDEAWWNTYWKPTLIAYGNSPMIVNPYLKNQGDGYLVGTVYDITMNREAARQWLNLSLTETNVAVWWSAVSIYYEFFWREWLVNQGNNIYDIFSGYQDRLWENFYAASVSEDIYTGDIHLKLSEVTWGYEILMTRWLTAANLNPHEPYWENFTLHTEMNDSSADVRFDATGMYNLRAVKSSISSENDGAWAWQPQKVDYVPSWASWDYHPSEFDPYANLTYTSWDAGDTVGAFGAPVSYDTTPAVFNLEDYMTLTVELPKGSDVPFYLGQPVPTGSIERARLGSIADYVALEYNGTATLGFTEPDLSPWYDPGSQILTLNGPMTFGNPESIPLEHGLPWIEIASTTEPPPNTPPSAAFTVTPDHGERNTMFEVDASGSSDLQSNWLQYRWDWQSDGIWDTDWSDDPTGKHSYSHFGVYAIHLQVKDAGGLTDDSVLQVSVGIRIAVIGNQKASIAQWTYTPTSSGEFTLMIENNGLRGAKLGVDDITSGYPEGIAYMRIQIRNDTGTWSMYPIFVIAGHEYLFTLTPFGHKGASALAYGSQPLPPVPMVAFVYTVFGYTVWTDASLLPGGSIVSYDWNWGDGFTSTGVMASHTYSGWGAWTITLTVTDIYGRTATVSHMLAIT